VAAPQDEVDRRAAHMVLRGVLYITSAFSIRSTGVERSSDANCSVLIVEGFPFRITVTPPAPASVSPPSCSLTPGSWVRAS